MTLASTCSCSCSCSCNVASPNYRLINAIFSRLQLHLTPSIMSRRQLRCGGDGGNRRAELSVISSSNLRNYGSRSRILQKKDSEVKSSSSLSSDFSSLVPDAAAKSKSKAATAAAAAATSKAASSRSSGIHNRNAKCEAVSSKKDLFDSNWTQLAEKQEIEPELAGNEWKLAMMPELAGNVREPDVWSPNQRRRLIQGNGRENTLESTKMSEHPSASAQGGRRPHCSQRRFQSCLQTRLQTSFLHSSLFLNGVIGVVLVALALPATRASNWIPGKIGQGNKR